VHVVGNKTFAAAIDSTEIDYRYAAREGAEATLTAIELPEAMSVRCVTLAAGLGLSLAGIDLRQKPDVICGPAPRKHQRSCGKGAAQRKLHSGPRL
jgi:hypothetical protein